MFRDILSSAGTRLGKWVISASPLSGVVELMGKHMASRTCWTWSHLSFGTFVAAARLRCRLLCGWIDAQLRPRPTRWTDSTLSACALTDHHACVKGPSKTSVPSLTTALFRAVATWTISANKASAVLVKSLRRCHEQQMKSQRHWRSIASRFDEGQHG